MVFLAFGYAAFAIIVSFFPNGSRVAIWSSIICSNIWFAATYLEGLIK